MDARNNALQEIAKRHQRPPAGIKPINYKESFGSQVFTRQLMQKVLPKNIYRNIVDAMEGREKLKEEYADTIATAMQEWALSHGATHYTHWFQPLTGSTAEKHDSFLELTGFEKAIEK